MEPAGLCGRCTGVAVPLRVVPSPTGLPLLSAEELILLNCGVGEDNLESPLDCKEIQPVHSKGDQSWANYHRIVLISHASKVMLKILQARL